MLFIGIKKERCSYEFARLHTALLRVLRGYDTMTFRVIFSTSQK